MTKDLAHAGRRLGLFDSGSCPHETRRRFLKGVLAGAAVTIVGAAGFSGKVVASPEFTATDGTSGTQQGTLSVGRLKVATKNFAKFTVPERDQTHAMFNNIGDLNSPHEAMIAAQWSPDKFQAMTVWDWPAWDHPYGHAWHSIYHGVDCAASMSSTDSRFPLTPLSKYGSLMLDIPNVYVAGEGKWGLAFDMFLFKRTSPQTYERKDVQAEIFIALKRHGYPTPTPELGSLTSCGVTYGYGKWETSQTNNFFWRKDDPAVPFRQQINIYDFINYLKARGIAQDSNILAGVYFGVEPIEGSGTWRIDSFYVTLS